MDALLRIANTQTRLLQNGYLRFYFLIIVVTTVGLAGYILVSRVPLSLPTQWPDVRFYEILLGVIILTAAFLAIRAESRISHGIVNFKKPVQGRQLDHPGQIGQVGVVSSQTSGLGCAKDPVRQPLVHDGVSPEKRSRRRGYTLK